MRHFMLCCLCCCCALMRRLFDFSPRKFLSLCRAFRLMMHHLSHLSLVILYVFIYLFIHSCCINKSHFYFLLFNECRQPRTGVVAENWFLPQHSAGILSVTASGREKVDVWMSGNDLEHWSASGRKRRGRRRRGASAGSC